MWFKKYGLKCAALALPLTNLVALGKSLSLSGIAVACSERVAVPSSPLVRGDMSFCAERLDVKIKEI